MGGGDSAGVSGDVRPGSPYDDALAEVRRTAVPGAPLVLHALYSVEPNDTETLLDLAAMMFAHTGWRNTEVEDAHAAGAIDDADQIVSNIAAWRIVRAHMPAGGWSFWPHPPDLSKALANANRDVAGTTLTRRLRGTGIRTADLRRSVKNKLWDAVLRAASLGADREVLPLLALSGAVSCGQWFGTPWWPELSEVFWNGLPAQAASDDDWAGPAARRLLALPDGLGRLQTGPDRLDHQARQDLITAGIGYVRLPAHGGSVVSIEHGQAAVSAAMFLGV